MVYTSLDSIVKGILMKKGYPIHFWIDFMVYAADITKELMQDDLHIINTSLLPVNDYNAIDIPSGCLEVCNVFIRAGQHMKPLVPDDTINPLNNLDSNFNITTYAEANADNASNNLIYFFNNWNNALWNTTHWNNYGEPTGRFFGGTGSNNDGYKVIKERNQIQLDELIDVDFAVVQYIGDGQNVDSASQIDPAASKTIETFVLWQHKEHNRSISEGDKERARQLYIQERKILRARKNPMTIEVLRRIVNKNTYSFK